MAAEHGTTGTLNLSRVLRALREARGITQDGWAGHLGVGRRTVQRWEQGLAVPDATAEAAILAYCEERGLYRRYSDGPLAGVTLTPEWLRHRLAEARLGRDISLTERVDARVAGALPPPGHLPMPLTDLIGRERETFEIVDALERSRLVTLTGPGGVGKTRLALAVAEAVRDRYADGAAFVDLAPLDDPSLLIAAIAHALGLRESERRTVAEMLPAALHDRTMLLVLDNLERLVEAAPALAELLRVAPDLRILATSRRPLGLGGEREYPVSPLPVPDPEAAADPTALRDVPAVVLFIARGRDARPDFALTAANAAAVAAICARLDGLPLALELAAARVRILPPEAIFARLERRLPFLTGGARDAPARQRTLRDTIAWSHDLLSSSEQMLFRRLAVFAGGCTLAAAEAVCNPDGDLGVDVLDGIAALVEQSLLRRVDRPEGEPRFAMLDSIREFALEWLAASDEAATARARHRAWYLEFARIGGLPQVVRVERMAAETDNPLSALASSIEDGDLETGLRLAERMVRVWEASGRLSEGRRWLEALLARADGAPVSMAARYWGLRSVCQLATSQGDLGRALSAGEEALTLRRRLGPPAAVAQTLVELSAPVRGSGNFSRAMALLEEALSIFRELGDDVSAAHVMAAIAFQEATAGNLDRAAALLDEARSLIAATGLPGADDFALGARELLALSQGDARQAATLYRRSLAVNRRIGNKYNLAWNVLGVGGVAWISGDHETAARLLGAAEAAFDAIGAAPPLLGNRLVARAIAEIRAALGTETLATLRTEGRSLSLDQAVALALVQIETVAPAAGQDPDVARA